MIYEKRKDRIKHSAMKRFIIVSNVHNRDIIAENISSNYILSDKHCVWSWMAVLANNI
jgi:hypothetical protein